jgi:hypothetical protein
MARSSVGFFSSSCPSVARPHVCGLATHTVLLGHRMALAGSFSTFQSSTSALQPLILGATGARRESLA